jgi:hypothetical protein
MQNVHIIQGHWMSHESTLGTIVKSSSSSSYWILVQGHWLKPMWGHCILHCKLTLQVDIVSWHCQLTLSVDILSWHCQLTVDVVDSFIMSYPQSLISKRPWQLPSFRMACHTYLHIVTKQQTFCIDWSREATPPPQHSGHPSAFRPRLSW